MSTRSKAIEAVLDRRTLRRLAGSRSFERGEEYFQSKTVKGLAEKRGRVTARVTGSRPYEVRLWVEKEDIGYSCSCPMGMDGAFCKHCVAVGLAWLEGNSGSGESRKERKRAARPATRQPDIRGYLDGLGKEKLVEMLMEQAPESERLGRRLHLEASRKGRKGVDLAAFKAAIDDAVEPDGYVDYREAYDYSKGIDDAIDSIESLLKEGHAAEAVELVEYALDAVEAAVESVDDSGGALGMVLDRLAKLHLTACKKAEPEPVDLAKRLLDRELRSEYAPFDAVVKRYARVLGKEGLAAYRKFAEEEWSSLPALGPGSEDRSRYGRRGRLACVMENLAERSRDVEALVKVKSRDLSYPGAYLAIAETYKRAGKIDLALDWAERGLKDFPKGWDPGLHDFVVAEYHRRKRHDDAIALEWKKFSERPELDGYQKLKASAEWASKWPAWRKKALAFLREDIEREKRQMPQNLWRNREKAEGSRLVRVFLWEKDVEAAWMVAKDGGCSSALWLELAEKRGKTHPEDAIPIYEREIAETLRRTSDDAYRDAIGHLRKVHSLLAQLGRQQDFARLLDRLRTEHKRKRNFLKLLGRAKWK